jgi:hypothetical protein
VDFLHGGFAGRGQGSVASGGCREMQPEFLQQEENVVCAQTIFERLEQTRDACGNYVECAVLFRHERFWKAELRP